MPRRKLVSQRLARKLLKKVQELEDQNHRRIASYFSDYPGGVHVQTLNLSELPAARLQVASKLGHALVAKISGADLVIYAVKP